MNNAHLIEDKAGAPGTGAKTISQSSRAAIRSRSTATEAQRERILAMLRTGEKSTFDFRRAGIMQSSTRIFELRQRGYCILTVARRDMFDADGYRHERVAVYALIGEPDAPGTVQASNRPRPHGPALSNADGCSVSAHGTGQAGTVSMCPDAATSGADLYQTGGAA
jgi:hypothetical protein